MAEDKDSVAEGVAENVDSVMEGWPKTWTACSVMKGVAEDIEHDGRGGQRHSESKARQSKLV